MLDIEAIRLLLFVGGLLLFFGLETWLVARPWRVSRVQRLTVHVALAVLNSVVVRVVVLLPFLWWVDTVVAHGWGLVSWLGLSGLPEIVATVLVFDFCNYWWHRLNHRVGFLWRFHKVHHTDTHLDVTTALRFHPGELLLSYGFKAVWVLLWGPSLLAFVVFEMSVNVAAQFHHCNIRFPARVERWCRYLVVTPTLHTGHHTVTRRTGDANFSVLCNVWDRLFGTYREPTEAEMQRLGLAEGREQDLSLWQCLLAPLRAANQTPPRES